MYLLQDWTSWLWVLAWGGSGSVWMYPCRRCLSQVVCIISGKKWGGLPIRIHPRANIMVAKHTFYGNMPILAVTPCSLFIGFECPVALLMKLKNVISLCSVASHTLPLAAAFQDHWSSVRKKNSMNILGRDLKEHWQIQMKRWGLEVAAFLLKSFYAVWKRGWKEHVTKPWPK